MSSPPKGADLRIGVLGPLEVVGTVDRPEHRAPLRSAGTRRLLAALVVAGGDLVSADRLADAVWGDDQPQHPEAALQSLVSRLRAALRRLDPAGEQAALVSEPPGYRLTLAPGVLDAAEFEKGATDGRRLLVDDPETAAAVLDRVLGLWRGSAYAGLADELFARAAATRLEELRTAAVEDRVDADLARGELDAALGRARRLVDVAPLRERAQAQLLVALYRSGRQTEALSAYERHRLLVADELGVDPAAGLRELHERMLRQDPALVAPTPPAGRPTSVAVSVGAPTVHVGSVPAPPEPLLGREELLDHVCAALEPGRCLTLLGPGGVGKTSLAAAIALSGGDGPESPRWCDLSSVSADGVADLLITTLDIRRRGGQTAEQRLVEYLRSRRLLLVFDNCEHVLATVAGLVEHLTHSCPEVTLLATSRERLDLERETVVPVHPLEPDAARRLFLRRAEQAAPGFLGTGHEERDGAGSSDGRDDAKGADDPIGEICARLDGLPLAIELAATRMTSMHPRDLAARLTWRFRLLHNRRRPAPARHRTLRAVVDWSYDMLTPEEQFVFERLSVFAGSFSLEDAERVVVASRSGAPSDLTTGAVADAVCELVERSLVAAAAGRRYRLLETLRAYGRERLEDAGLADVVARAHARWAVETAEAAARELHGPRHTAATRTLDRLFDELRAAHGWALVAEPELAFRVLRALAVYAEDRSSAEVTSWARRTLAAARARDVPAGGRLRLQSIDAETDSSAESEIDPDLLLAAYGVAAAGARFAGELSDARRLVDEGLGIRGSDDPARVFLLYVATDVALFEARWDDVDELVGRIERCTPSPFLLVTPTWALVDRVLALAYRGRTSLAVAEATRLLENSRSTGNETGVGFARYALGEALAERDPATALRHHEHAFAVAERIDLRFLRGIALVSVASLSARLGRDEQAVRSFTEVVEHWHRDGNWVQQWTTMRNIAGLLVRLGCDVEAAELLAALRAGRRGGPIVGPDAERLTDAETAVAARLGPDAFSAATEHGASRTDDEVVAVVLSVLRTRADAAAPTLRAAQLTPS